MKVHHIGYLVKKMEKAKKSFLDLGYKVTQDVVFDEYRGIDICFMEMDGYVVELVSPVTKESVVADMYKKVGNSPYHICYETDNFDEDVKKLQEQNYIICSEKHPAPAIDGKNVCFMINPSLGMIELVEA